MTVLTAEDWRSGDLPALPAIAARRALRVYLVAVGLVMFLLLVTAWSIDLAENFSDLSARAAETGASLPSVLVPYLGYRAVDIVTRLLPIACFIGLFAAEALRRYRLETVVLAVAGLSPLQALLPVAVFAVLAGGLQYALETHLRPAAVFAQVDLGVGGYAERFRRGPMDDPRWFVTETDALRAKVIRSDEPELREVELYRGFADERLTEVVTAERATPTAQPFVWRLHDVTVWGDPDGGTNYSPRRHRELDVEIRIVPEQVTYFGVAAFYLPDPALQRLAEARTAPNLEDIDVAVWRRITAALLPGAFALLGASLAQIVWAGRVPATGQALGACFFGYGTIVSVKVFWALGELGALPAFAATLIPVLFAVGVSTFIQAQRS